MEFIFDFIYNPKLETLKKIVRSIRKDNKHINDSIRCHDTSNSSYT